MLVLCSRNLFACAGIYLLVQEFICLCRNLYSYAGIYMLVHACARIYMLVQEFTCFQCTHVPSYKLVICVDLKLSVLEFKSAEVELML